MPLHAFVGYTRLQFPHSFVKVVLTSDLPAPRAGDSRASDHPTTNEGAMLQLHIPVEVQRDTLAPNAVLDTKIERRLGKMIKGNRDITGAAVSTKEHAPRRADAQFEARIVLYRRGANLSALERAPSESQALLAALDAIERQLRKHRTIKRTRLRA